jgi:hypothetical protein
MWTREHRTIHHQSGERLPSDLTDAQWAHLEPLIPPADPGGRPRKTDMRAAMNAIFYLLRTGCPWRYLPRGPSCSDFVFSSTGAGCSEYWLVSFVTTVSTGSSAGEAFASVAATGG